MFVARASVHHLDVMCISRPLCRAHIGPPPWSFDGPQVTEEEEQGLPVLSLEVNVEEEVYPDLQAVEAKIMAGTDPNTPLKVGPAPLPNPPPTHLATWPAKTHSTLQLTVIFTAADDHLPATYCCGGGFVYGCVVFVVVVVVVVVCACGCIWVSSLFFFATAWISLASFLALFLHHYPMGVGVNSAGHSLIH